MDAITALGVRKETVLRQWPFRYREANSDALMRGDNCWAKPASCLDDAYPYTP
jgi:hypothetical protein